MARVKNVMGTPMRAWPRVVKARVDMAGSIACWQVIREQMKTAGRWNDILY